MCKPALLIMAAGLGSRYGGLKQIDPVDPLGRIIIDYSIYDAVMAGFSRVICVIKPELEEEFEQVIGRRIAPHIRLEYAYQRLDALPEGFAVPRGRTKPWGTAHAVLCAKHLISGPFAVINADDFYGRTAIKAICDFLQQEHEPHEHAMVGYRIENTLTEHGHVARGVCEADSRGFLTSVAERTHIEPRPGGAAFTEDGEHFSFIPMGTMVSMNLWGFQKSMMGEIEARFADYLAKNLPADPLKCEYFLPLVPNQLVAERAATVRILPTGEKWYGVTYREDMPRVREAIARMKLEGLYPEHLWRL